MAPAGTRGRPSCCRRRARGSSTKASSQARKNSSRMSETLVRTCHSQPNSQIRLIATSKSSRPRTKGSRSMLPYSLPLARYCRPNRRLLEHPQEGACYPAGLMSDTEAPPPTTAPEPPEAEGGAPAGPPSGASGAQAILAADVGTVYTKVYLLEDVGGERRLVAVGRAPSAGSDGAPDPWAGLSGALAQALRHAGREDAPLPAQRLLMTSAGTVPRLAIVAPGPADARAVTGALEGAPGSGAGAPDARRPGARAGVPPQPARGPGPGRRGGHRAQAGGA